MIDLLIIGEIVDVDNNPEGSNSSNRWWCGDACWDGMGTAAVHETTTLFQWRHDFFYMGNWNQK